MRILHTSHPVAETVSDARYSLNYLKTSLLDRINERPVKHGRSLALTSAVPMRTTVSIRSLVSVCLAIALVALTASSVSAQSTERGPKLDSVLRHRARQLTGRSRIIVQFKGDADVRVFGRGVTGRKLNRSAQVGEVDNLALATVAADPRVERVMVDRPAFATMERTGQAIGATLARSQYGVTGRGIGVAIIDSGITNYHDDLYRSASGYSSRRVVYFKDFTRDVSPNLWFNEVQSDDYGHGTHVAGIIAGSGYDSGGRRVGVAPGAKLLGLKVLDSYGQGYVSDVIAAIDHAIAVRSTHNVRVINLSVASGVFESVLARPTDTGRPARRRSRHRRGRGRGQPRSRQQRPCAVGRHHLAWQRSMGADRRCVEPSGHGAPQ